MLISLQNVQKSFLNFVSFLPNQIAECIFIYHPACECQSFYSIYYPIQPAISSGSNEYSSGFP